MTDPCGVFTLQQSDKQGLSGFNLSTPNLGPEAAKSFTAGVVINPKSIAALRNQVDDLSQKDNPALDALRQALTQGIVGYQSSNPYGT